VVDWVHAFANGSYSHYAEPRHSTEAITDGAIKIIEKHSAMLAKQRGNEEIKEDDETPLFLYVAYTAAHSPLQPMPEHQPACAHIPHKWRREYCGMVMGLDEGIQNISDAITAHLSDNTIMYVFSDNGGSVYFGGLNMPYRGSKSTPHEGGVKVPAFIVDYSADKRFIGEGGRDFYGLMHSADILPTLMGFAGVPNIENHVPGMDGFDFSGALSSRSIDGPRTEMLLELYNPNEFVFFNESLKSYRKGDMKLIEGLVRDPFMHYESTGIISSHQCIYFHIHIFHVNSCL
jgi:arylsulfatase A-like enzyme